MNPALYVEILQTRRGIWKLLLFCLGIPIAARFLLGDSDLVILSGLLLAQLGGIAGVGTFLEELNRGQMRFLYALPLRRGTLFAVKLLGGLAVAAIAAAAVLAAIGLSHLLRPLDLGPLRMTLDRLHVDPGATALAAAAYMVYSFSGGLFSILLCREPRHGQLVNLLFAFGPLAALAILLPGAERLPSLHGMAAAFLIAGIVLGFGGRWLFVRRNPFDEGASLLPGGLAHVAAAALLFSAAVSASSAFEAGRRGPDPRRVMTFLASPDGEQVVVTTAGWSGLSACLLDAEGRIATDLGNGIQPSLPHTVPWSPDRRWLLLQRFSPSAPGDAVAGDSAGGFSTLLVDRATGAGRPLPSLPSATQEPLQHAGWTADNKLLFIRMRQDKGTGPVRLSVYLQDISAGGFEEIDVSPPSSGSWKLVAGREIVFETGEEGDARELVLFDLASRKAVRLPLGRAVVAWAAAPDAKRLLLAHRDVNAERIAYRLILHDRTDGRERTLLAEPDLPSATLVQAAQGEMGWVSLSPLEGTSWVRCEGRTDARVARSWLIDLLSERLIPLPDIKPLQEEAISSVNAVVSPDGTTLLLTTAQSIEAPSTLAVTARIHAIVGEGLRPMAEHVLDGYPVTWLGHSRLLYLKRPPDWHILGNGELWTIEVSSGKRSRFFDGARASAGPERRATRP